MPAKKIRRRRTQTERRELSGQSLMRAATAVIADVGVSAATFREVSVRSGYSRSLVTQRFGSKRGLIDEIMNHAHCVLQQVVENVIDRDLNGFDTLALHIDTYLAELANNPTFRAYFRLLSSAVAENAEVPPAIAGLNAEAQKNLAAALGKGQSDGSIRPDIAIETAALMVSSLEFGLSMRMLLEPEIDLETIREANFNMLRWSFAKDQKSDRDL